MKIAINAMFFKFPASGSGQYLIHLLNALTEVDTQNEYVLIGPEPIAQSLPILGSDGREGVGQSGLNTINRPLPYQVRTVPGPVGRNASIEKFYWEQLTFPAAAQKAGVDLLHVPYFAPPALPRMPNVVTIHDIIPLRLPVYHAAARTKAYMSFVARAAHRATRIITISQHAKQDIMDALKLPSERIRVIYEAAGDEYHPILDHSVLASTQVRYGLGERYILYIGGLDARKNVPQLVRAFAHLYRQLDDPHLQLFIAGNPDKQGGALFPDPRPIAADLGMTGQILYRFVEEEDKPAIYSGASAFVFPSLYEGFGLTPLEAMSCGTPVICSNRTSLPEVTGDAAISLDPNNTQSLVEAMRSVLTNSELRNDLKARSLQRAAQFSWRKAANETMAVYEEAFSRRKK